MDETRQVNVNISAMAKQVWEDVKEKNMKAKRANRVADTKKASQVFRGLFGVEIDLEVGQPTIEIGDGHKMTWGKREFRIEWYLLGTCRYCGKEVESKAVSGLSSLGKLIEKFDPSYYHHQYNCVDDVDNTVKEKSFGDILVEMFDERIQRIRQDEIS